jgi:hypothetical protein
VTQVLYRPRALASVAWYDRYRKARGHTPIGEDIIDAIERSLVPYQSWDDVPAPMFRVRGEPLPVKRMLVTVRSKRFTVYVVPVQAPGVVGIAAIRHPGQRRIEH